MVAAAAIMAGLLASPLMAAPMAVMPVNEKSLLHVPDGDEYRFRYVARGDGGQGWPFSVAEGWLLCIWIAGMKATYFHEIVREPEADADEPRMVVVSTDPLDIVIGAIGSRSLLVPDTTLEDMIPMLGPFEQMARALCDQPPGTVIRPEEP